MLKNRLRVLAGLSASVLFAAGTAMLTGCAGGVITAAEDSAGPQVTLDGVNIHGNVHGGVFPIQGANIELWQTGVGTWNTTTNSYAPSFLNGTSNPNFIASTTSAKVGDSTGLAPGYFAFSNASFTCTAGNYLYLTTTGGGTIPTKTNSNVVQIGVIGVCPAGGSSADTAYLNNVNVFLSELSTVAAGYALDNFISIDSDPNTGLQRVNITAPLDNNANSVTAAFTTNPVKTGCTGTGNNMTCNGSGLANGFANALNLVDSVRTDNSFPPGTANSSLSGNANAIAPQALVNTIGNILQSCVDSGPSSSTSLSSVCSTLFSYSPTSSAGTPKNTLQVVLNLARTPAPNPTASPTGIANLFSLQTSNAPFVPAMASAPTAFTLSILYPGAAVGDSSFKKPADVALDGLDNVFVAYTQSGGVGALAGMSASGSPLFSAAKPLAAVDTILNPASVSVDPSGNIWISDDTPYTTNPLAGNVTGFTKAGAYVGLRIVPGGSAAALAIDSSNNLFVGRDSTDTTISAYLYGNGSTTYTQRGSKYGVNLLRAAIDSYGTFKAVGSNDFLSWAPDLPVNPNTGYACPKAGTYAESYVALDKASAKALALDNRASNYTAFIMLNDEISTGNTTIATGQPTCFTATATNNNYLGSVTNTATSSDAAAMDGSGNLFWSSSIGQIFYVLGIEGKETAQNYSGTLGIHPCFLTSRTANSCTQPTSLSGMAIDSSGAMWVASPNTNSTAYLVQTFGMGAPTWPLLAYENSGVTF